MKQPTRYLLPIAALIAATALNTQAANPAPGYIDFGKFPSSNGEFVEIDLKGNLLSMVRRLTQKEESGVGDLLSGLHSIRVNVIGLNEENREDVEKRVKAIRTELDTKGWERVVTAQKQKEDVGIYLKTRGEEAVEGLVITVQDKRETVLINVVGDIKLEKLGAIGESLNIDPLKKLGRSLEKESGPEK
ncbi:MAG: DUF4252 domain-containing protein [Verrucomicrobiales bacterium]|nr:DUF4252 domain-containing protein [Verrucomicrobiales bacterium]